jgi:hypothetical protein
MSITSAARYNRAGSTSAAPAKKPFDPSGAQFEPHAMALQQVKGFYGSLINASTVVVAPDAEEDSRHTMGQKA